MVPKFPEIPKTAYLQRIELMITACNQLANMEATMADSCPKDMATEAVRQSDALLERAAYWFHVKQGLTCQDH